MDKVWWTEPDGALAAEAGEFRLVVRKAGRWVRYLVLRRADSTQAHRPALLASGHADEAGAAMRAAERTAARLAGRTGRA